MRSYTFLKVRSVTALRMWLVLLVLLLAATEVPELALATTTQEFEVAVPILGEGGIQLLHVTHQRNVGGWTPGMEISLTSAPAMVDLEGVSQEDQNLASLLHFKVETEYRDNPQWRPVSTTRAHAKQLGHRYVIDSLRVTLDVSALSADTSSYLGFLRQLDAGDAPDRAVEATVAAILDNARRSWPPITSIKLQMVGPAQYRHYAKVYPVRAQRPRQF